MEMVKPAARIKRDDLFVLPNEGSEGKTNIKYLSICLSLPSPRSLCCPYEARANIRASSYF